MNRRCLTVNCSDRGFLNDSGTGAGRRSAFKEKNGGNIVKFSEMPYERANIPQVCEVIQDAANAVKASGSAAEVLAQYERFKSEAERVWTMQSLSYIRHTMDTRDAFYDAENAYYDEFMPNFEATVLTFYREMLNAPYRDELELELGSLWFRNAALQQKGMDERVIAEMQQDNAICSEYKKLLASAQIAWDGKTLNLAQLRAYQLSADRDVRKRAYAARTTFFQEHAEQLDEIFDRLVKLRTAEAKKLGYASYTDLGYIRMMRNSYTREDVERFRTQVKQVIVPLAEKLHEARRKKLNLDALKFYDEDVFDPNGNPEPHGTPEEMFEAGRRMYAELSEETHVFFEYMIEHELFDAQAKEGKSGGGYCTSLPMYGAPFVFSNFNGTSEDVDTLTHECGHAFNFYLARNMKVLEYRESTLDVAEIHSMSMEFFTENWMHLFFGSDARRYCAMHLAAALIFLPYGCLVDEFQHEVYDHPNMTPAERKATWRRLEQVYQPHLDYDGDPFFGAGGLWQRQTHIYERPFYYIDYCVAQTCALQYRIWMQTDFQSAWDSYCTLAKKSGSVRLTELLAEAGLRSPFEDGCMQYVAEHAEAILNDLTDKA